MLENKNKVHEEVEDLTVGTIARSRTISSASSSSSEQGSLGSQQVCFCLFFTIPQTFAWQHVQCRTQQSNSYSKAYIHTCMHTRTHAYMHARTHARIHARTHAYMHARTHACSTTYIQYNIYAAQHICSTTNSMQHSIHTAQHSCSKQHNIVLTVCSTTYIQHNIYAAQHIYSIQHNSVCCNISQMTSQRVKNKKIRKSTRKEKCYLFV